MNNGTIDIFPGVFQFSYTLQKADPVRYLRHSVRTAASVAIDGQGIVRLVEPAGLRSFKHHEQTGDRGRERNRFVFITTVVA